MMKTILTFSIYIFFSIISFTNCTAETTLETRVVAKNLKVPWEILWGPDNWIWMTERYGGISRVNPENGEVKLIHTIDDVVEGSERGLLGMALHPDFNNHPYVYVVYNYLKNNETKVKLVRFSYSSEKLIEPFILLENITGAGIHDGSRLWIDNDLKLFMTTGEAGIQPLAQDLSSLNGKVLRMNLDGSIPDDNPFQGSLIWSYGHRNAQGLHFANGKIYSSEHGPGTDDEINIIHKGRNYGWPNVHGYCDKESEMQFCEDSNVVEPIISLTPSNTLAVCGLDYYSHDLIPEWKNSLLLVTLKASKLVKVELDESGEKVLSTTDFFAGEFGRLRDLCVSPDGRVFIATSNRDGRGSIRDGDDKIIEIKPAISSVNENYKNSGSLFIYPNPSKKEVRITIKQNMITNSKIMIYDMLGRIVKSYAISKSIDSIIWDGLAENGNYCSSGIYRIVYTDGRKVEELPFIRF